MQPLIHPFPPRPMSEDEFYALGVNRRSVIWRLFARVFGRRSHETQQTQTGLRLDRSPRMHDGSDIEHNPT